MSLFYFSLNMGLHDLQNIAFCFYILLTTLAIQKYNCLCVIVENEHKVAQNRNT